MNSFFEHNCEVQGVSLYVTRYIILVVHRFVSVDIETKRVKRVGHTSMYESRQ